MKVVILAGGLGTRLMEETEMRPKPMVEIGGRPILWHVMKIYESFGFNDFIICLGYKGQMIKDYFLNYYLYNSDLTVDVNNGNIEILRSGQEKFKITLVDTGLLTNTAGRIKKIEKYLNNETFLMTYSDGLANISIPDLIQFHKKSNKIATLTTVQLPGRFGNITFDTEGIVNHFYEKPQNDGTWINGGYFVLEPKIFDYLNYDVENIQWETIPLVEISKNNNLAAFKHDGFWKCMDAMRDRKELEELWNSNSAPWKIW